MLISVIVCTFNRRESLIRLLNILAHQNLADGKVDYEIVVVDNNSIDGTQLTVEEFNKIAIKKARYVLEKKQGVSYARNRGMNEAAGNIITFTDDDCDPEVDWLENLYKCYSETDADIVAGRIVSKWNYPKPTWFKEKKIDGAIISWDLGEERKELFYGSDTPVPYTANLMMKTDLVKKIGYFNEKLGGKGRSLVGSEDIDFCVRALKAGAKVLYEPKAVVYHPVEKERVSKKFFRKRSFNGGRASAIMQSENDRLFLNVPRFLYRQIFEYFFLYIVSLVKFNQKESFFYENKILLSLGFFAERWFGTHKSKDGLTI
jgi:glucosyl-dolichyl phosphate glucuronosyltransferase